MAATNRRRSTAKRNATACGLPHETGKTRTPWVPAVSVECARPDLQARYLKVESNEMEAGRRHVGSREIQLRLPEPVWRRGAWRSLVVLRKKLRPSQYRVPVTFCNVRSSAFMPASLVFRVFGTASGRCSGSCSMWFDWLSSCAFT